MKIRIALFALALAACGCNGHMSVEDYSHEWRVAVLKYRAMDKSPDLAAYAAGETPGEASRRAAIAVADQLHQMAHDIQELDAPDSVQALQEQTVLFYDGQADAFRIYAEAVGSGNTGRTQQAAYDLNAYVEEHEKAVLHEIKRLATKDMFMQAWAKILKPLSDKERTQLPS